MHTQPNTSLFPFALVGIDLDGTLLNSQGEISPVNQLAVQQALSQGICISLISGRTPCGIMKFVRQLALTSACVGAGGAIIFAPDSGEPIKQLCLRQDEVLTILTLAQNLSLVVYCHEIDQIYYQNADPEIIDSLTKRTNCQFVEFTGTLS